MICDIPCVSLNVGVFLCLFVCLFFAVHEWFLFICLIYIIIVGRTVRTRNYSFVEMTDTRTGF